MHVLLYNLRITAKVIAASAKQQSLVSAESEVFEDEIRITDGEVVRVDACNQFRGEWFRRDYKTVHGEHESAQLPFQVVISIARNDDKVGRNGTLLRDDSRPVSFFNPYHE